MRIIQINTWDKRGGAARVAWNLHRGYLARGHDAWMAVGRRAGDDPRVVELPDTYRPGLARRALAKAARLSGSALLGRLVEEPRRRDERLGREGFDFPGSHRALTLPPPGPPDVINCHNLHGAYFDLRLLPRLAARAPLVLTLHDAWLLAGHCAHSFDCTRWRTGCGQCPDLSIYQAIAADASAGNWRRKRDIYARCRLAVVTPSRWLMDKVQASMLAPAMGLARVIPNGVDLAALGPGDRAVARRELGIDPGAAVLVFVAGGMEKNIWKDYATIRRAVEAVAEGLDGRPVTCLALGARQDGEERLGRARVLRLAHVPSMDYMRRAYQAGDIYLHAARADTFPNVVLEALACGLPVVATAVGGIPEQVRGLECPGSQPGFPAHGPDAADGVLTPPGDHAALAKAVLHLLGDRALLERLGQNAAANARRLYNLEGQVDAYLDFYAEAVAQRQGRTDS